ncbi:MAG: phosphate uptake regulator PhoU [Candidatus Melainabacteria bacterium]|nr:phosphate uptake regulator PhoU [Candidatus Melainabacteria bacterium]
MTTRTPLRRDLADLKQKVYLLGEKCIEVSDLYNLLLESYSDNLVNSLSQITKEIKSESKLLNDQCFLVLTLQQPLIKDLRFVIGSIQIVLNLEKITEQYSSTLSQISEVAILKPKIKEDLINMATKVQQLLRDALTLYLSTSLDKCSDISRTYSEITFLHNIIYKEILNEVAKVAGQKAQIEAQLLATIRSIEKTSDLTLNIVEQVSYIIIGKTSPENQK